MTIQSINDGLLWGLGIHVNIQIWKALAYGHRWRNYLGIAIAETISLGLILITHYVRFVQGGVWWQQADTLWIIWALFMAAVVGYSGWNLRVLLLFLGYMIVCTLGVAENWRAQDMDFLVKYTPTWEHVRFQANVYFWTRKWLGIFVALYLIHSLNNGTIRNPDKEPYERTRASSQEA